MPVELASVSRMNGFVGSGYCRTGAFTRAAFRLSKEFWQVDVHLNAVPSLVRA